MSFWVDFVFITVRVSMQFGLTVDPTSKSLSVVSLSLSIGINLEYTHQICLIWFLFVNSCISFLLHLTDVHRMSVSIVTTLVQLGSGIFFTCRMFSIDFWFILCILCKLASYRVWGLFHQFPYMLFSCLLFFLITTCPVINLNR